MQASATTALGQEKITRLLFKMAMPAITAQIINLLYTIVDRIYIGRMEDVGALALTGVGVCLPLIMTNMAFAALAGMGGAPRASMQLGKGELKSAEKTLGNSTFLLIVFSAVITAVYIIFGEQLLYLVGASENTIGYAYEYLSIYSIGSFFVQITLGLNVFITAQGFSKTSMLTVLIGAILNIVLDPIFIFVLDMGVSGAALATIISQGVSMMWVLLFLASKKSTLRLKLKRLKPDKNVFLPIVALGLSPFIMYSTESLLTITFNTSLFRYGGDLAVGAMTILASVMQMVFLPLTGLTQGAQPIISYNYGAGNAKRVKDAFKVLLISCLTFSFVLWLLVMLFPQMFILLFNNDAQLVEFTVVALRVYFAGVIIFGAQIACQNTFLALGNAKSSLFLALLRKIILLIPLIYILPNFFEDKTMAVFLAEPVADITAAVCTVLLFAYQFKKVMHNLAVKN